MEDNSPFSDWGAFTAVVMASALVLIAFATKMREPRVARLLFIGFASRVIGCVVMHFALIAYGGGDAYAYIEAAQRYAGALLSGNVDYYLDEQNWWGEQWWGSQSVVFASSVTSLLFGRLRLPQYFVFSMLSFGGSWLLITTFRRIYPRADWYKLALLLMVVPSLWFWTSTVGKEPLIMLGLSLAFGGVARLPSGRGMIWTCIGLLLVFAVRPQVCAVAAGILSFAHLFSRWKTLKPQEIVMGIFLVAGAAFFAIRGAGALGLESTGVSDAQGYVEQKMDRADRGVNAVEAPGTGVTAVPLAAINILLRPFPWEARSPTMFISSVEMVFLWSIVIYRARRIPRFAKELSRSPLFVASVIFVFVYAALLGMVIVNMGIITRQRVLILPYLILAVYVIPDARQALRFGARLSALAPSEFARNTGNAAGTSK